VVGLEGGCSQHLLEEVKWTVFEYSFAAFVVSCGVAAQLVQAVFPVRVKVRVGIPFLPLNDHEACRVSVFVFPVEIMIVLYQD